MRLRKLLKILGSILMILALLNSCEELLGINGDGDGDGDGNGNEQQATAQQASQYASLLMKPMGLLFDGFEGEESFNKSTDDGSVSIVGTFSNTTGAINFTVTLNNFTDGQSNVTVTTPGGNPIEVSGMVSENGGSLNVTGTAQLGNTEFTAVTVNLTITFAGEGEPSVTGTVYVDEKSFDAATLTFDFGGGDGNGGEQYTIDDLAGVWELVSVSEYDGDDNMWYDDYFPMDLAYEFTYDYDNDTPGNSDIDGDGTADTYDMGQYIEITSTEEMFMYIDILFDNSNVSVTAADLQANDMPVVDTGVYTLEGLVDDISIAGDGYTLISTNGHVDGMEVELIDNGDTMIISGYDVEVRLERAPDTVLDGVVILSEADAEFGIIEMFIKGGEDDGPVEFSMMLLSPMEQLMMNFDSLADGDTFTYENISGTKGTGGAFTAEINYSDYIIDEEYNVSLNGTIAITGVMSDVEFYADFDGTVTLTNAPVGSITIDYMITFVSEFEAVLDGSVTIDGEVITFTDYYIEMDGGDYGYMPYPAGGTAEELAAYYPLASVADIGMVFESAAYGMDPYADGVITGDGWEIDGTYTDAQSYTYTITLTNFYPDPDALMELSGITSGEATLDVNGDGTATLVSTGDIAIAGDDAVNSTVSFDLTLGIVDWKPDGSVTGTVTLDGTTYDASTDLMFDFGMDGE